jgi:hypothetical protein
MHALAVDISQQHPKEHYMHVLAVDTSQQHPDLLAFAHSGVMIA